jgi:outer membrane lipoprotein SlyB
MNRRRLNGLVLSMGFLLSSCAAQRPALYPNEQLKRVGRSAAERDIDQCMHEAKEYVAAEGRGGKVAQETAGAAGVGAVTGAAGGAAGGAVAGHAGRGAAAGAAGGAAAGATWGLIRSLTGKRSPSPVYQNFVDRCLRERGYEPIGWD